MTKQHEPTPAEKRAALLAGAGSQAAGPPPHGDLTMRSSQPRPAVARRPGHGGPSHVPPVDQAAIAAAVTAAMTAVSMQRESKAPIKDMDKTIPGGMYFVDGVLVDADNEAIEPPGDGDGGEEPIGPDEPDHELPGIGDGGGGIKPPDPGGGGIKPPDPGGGGIKPPDPGGGGIKPPDPGLGDGGDKPPDLGGEPKPEPTRKR